ncbi:hypothetical protein [Curtobacterium sp. B8]|uniref:hypothetical protein n=1 Tax=Curtobacterium sp. B8 TaxID=95611 RepID=UPI000348B47A|nr:hypothetical protein [Curtobacterium sp. B8]
MSRPGTALAVLRRSVGALRQLGALGQGSGDQVSAAVDAVGGWPVDDEFRAATAGLKRAELVAALGGPWRYVRGRLAAR